MLLVRINYIVMGRLHLMGFVIFYHFLSFSEADGRQHVAFKLDLNTLTSEGLSEMFSELGLKKYMSVGSKTLGCEFVAPSFWLVSGKFDREKEVLKLLCEGCEDSHIHLLERERVEDSETELGFVKEPSALSVKSDTNALDTFREDEGSLGVIRLKVGGD